MCVRAVGGGAPYSFRLAHIHRVTTRKPGSWAYGIAYGRPQGPREGPTKDEVLGALRPTVGNTVGLTTRFSGSEPMKMEQFSHLAT